MQEGLFLRCGVGRFGFDPNESANGLRLTAYFGDIVSHRVRPEVAGESASRRRRSRLVWEHGLDRAHGLSKYILEGVREFEDVCLDILRDFPVTLWGDGPG